MNRRLLPLGLLAGLLAACGYHFPGDLPERGFSPELRHARIRVEGPGRQSDPLMARVLRQRLEQRLRGADEEASAMAATTSASPTDKVRLVIVMEPPLRELHLEDRRGQADQYRITIRAQPRLVIDGQASTTTFPWVEGKTTYSELRAVTASRATREQAVTDALNQLADALAAVLAGAAL
ncbi:MAG: hypothetical protein HQL82_06385 [Magnetococcales bacterium]|nr:hypothetical protein [Magnetococcales bacterium]